MKIAMTGGHHSSALPLIDYIQEKDPLAEIIWFGHKNSAKGDENPTLEYIQIIEKNIPFINLPAGKFYKTYNIFRLAKIPLGFIYALYYLLKYKPDVIFSFGGYLAVPVVIVGWLLGIPSLTHEQTVVAGYANKLISIFAKTVLISHEESFSYFPDSKTVYSGLPLRRALFEIQSNNFIFKNNLPVLYITCGKTGSHKINEAIYHCLPDLLRKYNIIHQCGDHSLYRDFDKLSEWYSRIVQNASKEKGYSDTMLGEYYLRKFVMDSEIGEVFSKADVLLTRAGAHIVFEIKTFQKPAVLIPIPWVSHNEQYLNARTLEKIGLGVILSEGDLNCKNIIESLHKVRQISRSLSQNTPCYSEATLEIMYKEMSKLVK
ncbi:glycosyltransferase [Patescibacteria group bacterium]|nr:glycosyltransferase [Patescibacteria group bacterium]